MSDKRCDVCGAPMLHTNNEMCKNYHLQKEPMTSSSEQPPKEYIITESRLMHLLNELPCQFEPIVSKEIRSRPHPAPTPKFNSTELLLFAHDEWKRREERKHNHPEQDWVAGFLNGFLTDKKWAREHIDALLQAGRK